jgi:serine/threonine-protein kinase/endoribonuclease IRE1
MTATIPKTIWVWGMFIFWLFTISLVGSSSITYEMDESIHKNKELILQQQDNLQSNPRYQQIDDFILHNNLAQINDFQITNLVLTSDIEGNLNAVNRKTGELLWSLIGGQPLVIIQSDDDKKNKLTHTTPVSFTSKESSSSNYKFTQNNYPRYENSKVIKSNTNNGGKNYNYQKFSSSSYNDNNNNNNNNNRNIRNSKNEITWIVEPFGDGTVYHFTGNDGLEKLPISIKQFVLNSPFCIDDQFIYTGKRVSGLVKINARTGAIIETYGLDQIGVCSMDEHENQYLNEIDLIDDEKNFNNNNNNDLYNNFDFDFDHQTEYHGSHDYNLPENEIGPFITLGKTVYDLTIHSKNNTSWNITYVQWGPNNLHNNLIDQNIESIDDIYIQPFHDSSLLALDVNSKSIKWVSNLPYVTINIFDVFANSNDNNEYIILPHPLDHKSHIKNKNHESTFIDTTKEGSWYALSENHYPSLVRSAPLAKYITNERWRLPSIFSNDDLLEISIAGVHDNSLKNKLDKGKDKLNIINNNHLVVYQSATAMNIPAKYAPGIDHSKRLIDAATHNRLQSNDKNENNLLDYNDSKSPTSTSTFKKSSFSNLLYRAFENVFVALICLGIFYILTRLGLFKPFTQKIEDPLRVITIDQNEKIPSPSSSSSSSLELQENIDSQKLNNNTIENIPDDTLKTSDSVDTINSISTTFESTENGNDDSVEEMVKRKRKRGSRGGKKNKKKELLDLQLSKMVTSSSVFQDKSDYEDEEYELKNNSRSNSLIKQNNSSEPIITKISNNLTITDDVLGFGSHGTIVFKGYFENRPVAVKRMLLDFYDVASHEINLLQESDDHSNVVRYFCSQENNKFLYIALELCSASLEDVIEKKKDLGTIIETKNILFQIANGVNHLHSLKIVHRDIKPQNILVATSKKIVKINENNKQTEINVRFLISDFGLCKKLDHDQSSFRGTTANAAGTSGWRAPELLLDTSPAYAETNSKNRVRLTRSLDVFSTGCVFYYVLTGGYHPFGDRYIREGNIIKNECDLSKLNRLPDAYTIKDLIGSMIQKDPMLRPDMSVIIKHPYFWSNEKKLDFLLKVSDRFEIEKRDPPSKLLLKLESISTEVLGMEGWFEKFDSKFIDNLGKYRKYNTHKIMDLLRAIRNKYHHYQDLPKDLATEIGSLPDGFYWYFAKKFPCMLLVVYKLVSEILRDDELLAQFF